MRHKLLVLTVKKFLQSVYIYGSYRKIKTGVPFFGPPGIFMSWPCSVPGARMFCELYSNCLRICLTSCNAYASVSFVVSNSK